MSIFIFQFITNYLIIFLHLIVQLYKILFKISSKSFCNNSYKNILISSFKDSPNLITFNIPSNTNIVVLSL